VVEAVEPASVVQRVERRPPRAGAEQPAQLPIGVSAGLVEMRDRRRGDLGVHLVQERREILAAAAAMNAASVPVETGAASQSDISRAARA
jgi:hypothetical protein